MRTLMYVLGVRTTIALDEDVYAAVQKLRRESGLGVSEAVNQLARRGLTSQAERRAQPFRQRTANLGLRVDVSSIAEALETLESGR